MRKILAVSLGVMLGVISMARAACPSMDLSGDFKVNLKDLAALADASDGGSGLGGAAGELANRVAVLENEVAQLRETVQRLCAELGVTAAPVSPSGHE